MWNLLWIHLLKLVTIILYILQLSTVNSLEVIYAVNCGGDAHTDVYGIHYISDPLQGKLGTPSDYGKQLIIGRINNNDQILYQTERYHHSTFGYELPITQDGDYVLVLKFSEVYFNSPNMKVFDVVLNGEHTIVSDLDIFEKVGRGFAHDEYIPFKVHNRKLIYNDEESDIVGGKVKVEFIKGYRDNPKINAIAVIRGKLADVPKLGPMPKEQDDFHGIQEEEEEVVRSSPPSGPRTADPYASDESSLLFPIIIAVGVFIPTVFCLCKL